MNGCRSAVMNWYSTKTATTTMRAMSQTGSKAKLTLYQRFQRSGSQWMTMPTTNNVNTIQ